VIKVDFLLRDILCIFHEAVFQIFIKTSIKDRLSAAQSKILIRAHSEGHNSNDPALLCSI
jgi:hypothetical protein